MAGIIDIALAAEKVVFVNTNVEHTNTTLINLGVANADTVVYTGNGEFTAKDYVGVDLLKGQYTVVTGGASVTADAGLFSLDLLKSQSIIIDGSSSFTIDASAVSIGGLLTNVLNKTEIAFTGAGPGTFTYNPPAIGLLETNTVVISQMGIGDKVVIPFGGGGLFALREDSQMLSLLPPRYSPYKDGYLHLTNGTLPLNTVNVKIKMSQAEYNRYVANKDLYLDGAKDTFYFPGMPDDGDDFEVPICFTRGVMIETPQGLVAIENLAVGDLVMTKDNGPQPIRWISSRVVGTVELLSRPNICPIRVSVGALGANTPEVEMLLSPQHRVMVRSKIAQKMFGSDEVLVAVKQLLQLDGIDIVTDFKPVEYFHFLFDRHEVVYANGAEAESLYPGPMAIKAIGAAAFEEICVLFPELVDEDYVPVAAREIPSGRMARKLAVFHRQAGIPLNS